MADSAEGDIDERKPVQIGRKRKVPANHAIPQMEAWNLRQKKRLLSLLSEYPIDAYESIASKMQGKDEEQVKAFIERIKLQLKNSHQQKRVKKEVVQRAPLEEWLDAARDMVEFENVDSSANLVKVLSVISNFEHSKSGHLSGYDGPDYRSIYKYLSQILQTDRHEDMVHLGPLECAIVLDMLHGLMDVLSEHDTTVQRNVMKWKYQLMDSRDQCGHSNVELLKKASENDFTDFIEEARMLRQKDIEHEKRYIARRVRAEQGLKSQKGKRSFETAVRESTEQSRNDSPAGTSGRDVSAEAIQTENEKGTETAIEETTETENVAKDKPVIKRHKPGRKGALDPPEVPYTEIFLVMPPKGTEIVNYNPRTKKPVKDRMDGKYQSLNQEEQLINNDLSREITYDVHRTELKQFLSKSNQRKISADEIKRSEDKAEEMDARYDPIMKTEEERKNDAPAKKPKLYSLNPFCLPVTLLDLNA